jgi:hypothetical protein
MMHLAAGAVVLGPDTAMQFDHRRERAVTLRPIQPHQQRLVAMAEIFNVLDIELMGGSR